MMQAHHLDPVTGEDEMAASLNAGDPFRSAASMLGSESGRRRGAAPAPAGRTPADLADPGSGKVGRTVPALAGSGRNTSTATEGSWP